MELTLKDRVITLNNVLPMYDTRSNIELKMSIKNKIRLSDSEDKEVVATPVGNGEFQVSFKTVEAITGLREFSFTDEELDYLKKRIQYIDRQGMFSDETYESYSKIQDEPFSDPNYGKENIDEESGSSQVEATDQPTAEAPIEPVA